MAETQKRQDSWDHLADRKLPSRSMSSKQSSEFREHDTHLETVRVGKCHFLKKVEQNSYNMQNSAIIGLLF